jgi:RHS repeat-associated protein
MSVQLPEACSLPSQGTGNNGNVRGLFYQDAAHPGLQHSEAFSYDGVNRLTGAVATGSQTYNLTYSYDTYGNMSCVLNQQTQGPCAQVTYTSENKNQLATIAGGAVSYDAAGNLTQDASQVPPCSYTWDAESRLKTVSGCQSDARVYNALGQVAELAAPNGNLIESLYGTGGEELGRFYSFGTWLYTRVNAAGRMLASYGPINGTWYTRFFHVNALGSMTGMTQQAGGLYSDALYYPWGQFWTYRNLQVPSRFAGLEQVVDTSFDSTTDLLTSPTRNLNTSSGRWLTPDPGGMKVVSLSDPQTWNMYTYAGDNPETLNDPSGLSPWTWLFEAVRQWRFVAKSTGSQGADGNNFNQIARDQAAQAQKTTTSTTREDGAIHAQSTTTTTTTDAYGNTVTTVTTTNAYYSTREGQQGNFVTGSQATWTSVKSPDGKLLSTTDLLDPVTSNLNAQGAQAALGSATYNEAIGKATGVMTQFYNHPNTIIKPGLETMAVLGTHAFLGPVGPAVLAVEVILHAIELQQAVHGAP